MATIIKREGKKGVSYKIQVAVKDVGLGKIVTKSTTWKPQKGMSTKDTETACAVFADNFEKIEVNFSCCLSRKSGCATFPTHYGLYPLGHSLSL